MLTSSVSILPDSGSPVMFFRRNARLIAGASVFVIFWMLAYAFFVYTPRFAAKAVVIIKDSAITSRYVEPAQYYALQTTSSSSSNPVLNTMGLLKSNAISDALWEYFHTKRPEQLKHLRIRNKREWEHFYQDGSAFIKAKNQPGTDLISLQFAWSDAETAREGLIVIVKAFQEASRDLNKGEQISKTRYLNHQVAEIEKQLESVRRQKSAYQSKKRTVSLKREGDDLAGSRMEISNKLSQLESQAHGKENMAAHYRHLLGMSSQGALHAAALGQNSTMGKLQDELYRLEQQSAQLRTSLTDTNPKVQEVAAQIEQARASIRAEKSRTLGQSGHSGDVVADGTRGTLISQMLQASGEARDLRTQADMIRQRLGQINQDIGAFPEMAEALAQIEQKELSLSTALDQLRQKVLEGKLQEEQTLSNVFVVDSPRLPEKAQFPTRNHLIALSVMIGMGVGVAVAFLREQWRASGRRYAIPEWMHPLEDLSLPIPGFKPQYRPAEPAAEGSNSGIFAGSLAESAHLNGAASLPIAPEPSVMSPVLAGLAIAEQYAGNGVGPYHTPMDEPSPSAARTEMPESSSDPESHGRDIPPTPEEMLWALLETEEKESPADEDKADTPVTSQASAPDVLVSEAHPDLPSESHPVLPEESHFSQEVPTDEAHSNQNPGPQASLPGDQHLTLESEAPTSAAQQNQHPGPQAALSKEPHFTSNRHPGPQATLPKEPHFTSNRHSGPQAAVPKEPHFTSNRHSGPQVAVPKEPHFTPNRHSGPQVAVPKEPHFSKTRPNRHSRPRISPPEIPYFTLKPKLPSSKTQPKPQPAPKESPVVRTLEAAPTFKSPPSQETARIIPYKPAVRRADPVDPILLAEWRATRILRTGPQTVVPPLHTISVPDESGAAMAGRSEAALPTELLSHSVSASDALLASVATPPKVEPSIPPMPEEGVSEVQGPEHAPAPVEKTTGISGPELYEAYAKAMPLPRRRNPIPAFLLADRRSPRAEAPYKLFPKKAFRFRSSEGPSVQPEPETLTDISAHTRISGPLEAPPSPTLNFLLEHPLRQSPSDTTEAPDQSATPSEMTLVATEAPVLSDASLIDVPTEDASVIAQGQSASPLSAVADQNVPSPSASDEDEDPDDDPDDFPSGPPPRAPLSLMMPVPSPSPTAEPSQSASAGDPSAHPSGSVSGPALETLWAQVLQERSYTMAATRSLEHAMERPLGADSNLPLVGQPIRKPENYFGLTAPRSPRRNAAPPSLSRMMRALAGRP